MIVAILCPGPSLARFGWQSQDLIIGVNRAAVRFVCDVWAAGDLPLIEKVRDEVLGKPTLFTSANAAALITPAWPNRVVEFESLYDASQERVRWHMFTATAALWYAASQGATAIRVFGADWSGTKDFDGVAAGMNRSDARWELEAGIWNVISVELAGRGVSVDRVKL